MGISASSNFVVLYEASQTYLKHGPPLCRGEVAAAALRSERRLALGMAVAADDVYPITHGGVLLVRTTPNIGRGNQVSEGEVNIERIPHDPRWIAAHVVVAINPEGKRHDVPGLLASLFQKKAKAQAHVRAFSALAESASLAIREKDIERLGAAVNAYREGFDHWTGGRYTMAVTEIASRMMDELETKVQAWKPPGGGASESLIVVARDGRSRQSIIAFFEAHRWVAFPAYVTSGLCSEFMKSNREIRFTAGHRLDFVGAADLGQDHRIAVAGTCCSCAIEPRTEIVLGAS